MSGWQYRQTTILIQRTRTVRVGKRTQAEYVNYLQEFDDAANAHFSEMANAGWELVTTTSTTRSTASGSETEAHHFIWKAPR
ncbi:hypothetical protein [Actinoallomurus sp. NPDC050550]|uniref:hypothetical protein n=1 Tax=Actinoallomurus sp. NPDC050550 TaxID=3154937 RepID=UPI0033EE2E93